MCTFMVAIHYGCYSFSNADFPVVVSGSGTLSLTLVINFDEIT